MPISADSIPSSLTSVSMQGITKAFPGVLANDHIDMEIFANEVHALLGENGAGKSTLMKILYGFYKLDSGHILVNGQPVTIQSPHDARKIQIGMVFQDFSLIPAMTVMENLALFLPHLAAVLDMRSIKRQIIEISERYGLDVNPDALVSQLSIGGLQKVEILKLLMADARLLILDEPTRVLAPHEIKALFNTINTLKKDGYAIVLIAHKLKEVLECADRISVLRGGKLAGTMPRADATEEKLISLMFEKKHSVNVPNQRETSIEPTTPVLEFKDVWTKAEGLDTSLCSIDIEIHQGEIVGVAGVSGNGQKELGDLTMGLIPCVKGSKFIFGRDFTHKSTQEVRSSGVAFIPENPLTMSVAPFMTVIQNMTITRTGHYARFCGFSIDWQAVRVDIEKSFQKLGFSFPLFIPARSLSGGNLQRMVVARELIGSPRLIIASYVTSGLDVQSALAARQALLEARDSGAGILLISEDLEELFTLSDRLIVLYSGRIVGSFKPENTNFYEVGHLMTGTEVEHVDHQ